MIRFFSNAIRCISLHRRCFPSLLCFLPFQAFSQIPAISHVVIVVEEKLEDMFGLPHAGNSATAAPIVDCWKDKTKIISGIVLPTKKYSLTACLLNPFTKSFCCGEKRLFGFEEQPSIYDVLGRRTAVSAHEWNASAAGTPQAPLLPLSTGMHVFSSHPRP
jgi:hypothetical protein